MDADGFWRQYPVPISFEAPCEIVGTLLEHQDYKNPAGEHFPKLRIQLDDGRVAIIIASQARLLAALCEQKPAVGDRVRIRYMGEGERAAFGLNKTKEFTVEVRRQGSQSEERPDGISGRKGTSENVPQTGATT
jgi:hypothetical protein